MNERERKSTTNLLCNLQDERRILPLQQRRVGRETRREGENIALIMQILHGACHHNVSQALRGPV